MKNILQTVLALCFGLVLMVGPVAADNNSKKFDRAWFGMKVSGLSLWNAKQAGLEHKHGVIITKVDKGDVAEKNGFLVDDVLLSINGKKLLGHEYTVDLLSKLGSRARVKINVLRAGKYFAKSFVAGAVPMGWKSHFEGVAAHKQKDYLGAVKLLKAAAKEGVTIAMIKLGDIYRLGQGVKPSGKQAARWYRMAVDRGDTEGLLGIGVLYYNGNGFEKSYKNAADAFTIAAANGSFVGKNNLAIMADQGLGTEKDPKHAAVLIFEALKHGEDVALNNMADTELSWSKEFIKTLQTLMAAGGIYDGELDGVMSVKMRGLIEKYFRTR